MQLRGKLLLVAVLPLIASLALTAFVLRHQEHDLARRQQELVRTHFRSFAEAELRHHVALALSTVAPMYGTGRDDAEIRGEAMRQLAQLDYGPDGYFFLYDYEGVNLMHPRQPELVGRNLIDMRDSRGLPAIRMMVEKARTGGGFVDYMWNKPSVAEQAPKLAYVTGLDRWRWMIGTGVYVDDIDRVMSQLDQQLASSVDATMRWIAITDATAIVLVLGTLLLLGINELRAADAKLTLLTRKVVSSQEAERAWLSRELHDDTSQTLVSVKLLVESALDRPAAQERRQRAILERALARINDALVAVRDISHRLRPAELDTLGLTTALQQLGEEMCEPAGTAFELQVEGEPAGLPDEIRTTLFRVSQEALTNVRKHAAARRVRVRLESDEEGLRLAIEDDGRGFDIDAVAQHPRRGIGLRNMRERLLAIGGSLDVTSLPQGTLVVARVPAASLRRFSKVKAS